MSGFGDRLREKWQRRGQQKRTRLRHCQIGVRFEHLGRHARDLGYGDTGAIHMLIIGMHPFVGVHAFAHTLPGCLHPGRLGILRFQGGHERRLALCEQNST